MGPLKKKAGSCPFLKSSKHISVLITYFYPLFLIQTCCKHFHAYSITAMCVSVYGSASIDLSSMLWFHLHYNCFSTSKRRPENTYQHSGRTFQACQDGQILFYLGGDWSSVGLFPPPLTFAAGNERRRPPQLIRRRMRPEHVWGWLLYHQNQLKKQWEEFIYMSCT